MCLPTSVVLLRHKCCKGCKGAQNLALCNARSTRGGLLGKPRKHHPRRKIGVTSKTPVGVISVVTLIRTDTTLDHSQKAEKV